MDYLFWFGYCRTEADIVFSKVTAEAVFVHCITDKELWVRFTLKKSSLSFLYCSSSQKKEFCHFEVSAPLHMVCLDGSLLLHKLAAPVPFEAVLIGWFSLTLSSAFETSAPMWICVYRFSRKKERWGKGIDEKENTMQPEWLQIYSFSQSRLEDGHWKT